MKKEFCLVRLKCYHKSCRSKFIHPFYNKGTEDDSLSEKPESLSSFTRSQVQSNGFTWKENCFICGDSCSIKHRKAWSKVEGTINETSRLYAKLLEISELKGDNELHSRLLSSKGDLVAVEARYHRNKGRLSKYIADRNIRAVKVSPKKNQSKDACVILKGQIKEKIETEKCVLELSDLRSQFVEICKANKITVSKTTLKAKHMKKNVEKELA